MQMSRRNRIHRSSASEEGFTLIFAIGAMLITSLLIFASFTFTINDEHASYHNTLQKQAFLAAATGVQEYEHQLQVNDDYWETACTGPSGKVAGEPTESYETSVEPANGQTACSTANPFATMIEKSGANENTFRIKSVGSAGGIHRSLVATFRVAGFLDFAYFTQYDDEDPYLSGQTAKECERYYEENGTRRSGNCVNIEFGQEDSVNGPMHTDDSALVECSNKVTFGREKQTWSGSESTAKGPEAKTKPTCSGTGPTYYTASGKFTEGAELRPPHSDSSVQDYIESGYEFTGRTKFKLSGEKITVENANFEGGKATPISWPANGLIYVASTSAGCNFAYSNQSGGSDTTTTYTKELPCGTAYVEGTYTKSLTIAAETDVVINGNILPTGVSVSAGTEPPAPSGTAVLGLMATRFVRIYHPCSGNNLTSGPAGGYLKNPFIYAAMLSTSHSVLVDNFNCGSQMGELNVYGAIAQKFRGVVALSGSTGYVKDYNYDERLATDEPPYFLAPLDAGWMISRETAAIGG
jgi:hypothetical protein